MVEESQWILEQLHRFTSAMVWLGFAGPTTHPLVNLLVIASGLVFGLIFLLAGAASFLWLLSWPFQPIMWVINSRNAKRVAAAKAAEAEAKATAIAAARAKADHDRWWTSRGRIPPEMTLR